MVRWARSPCREANNPCLDSLQIWLRPDLQTLPCSAPIFGSEEHTTVAGGHNYALVED